MDVLVAYATHHGSTREIAERIGATLAESGLSVSVAAVDETRDIAVYDAFVIGSAVYCGWLKEAREFVRRNRKAMAGRAVWLFSSGPLGAAAIDAQGRDVRAAAAPKEIVELGTQVGARGHRVFFGAYDPTAAPVGFLERTFRLVPNNAAILEAGDFRDWDEIGAWATAIAEDLGGASRSRHLRSGDEGPAPRSRPGRGEA